MADRTSRVPQFEFRKGVNSFPDFEGINRQDDPGAIQPNQFYLLQNARVEGSEVISRPGLYTGMSVGEPSGIIDNLETAVDGFLIPTSPISAHVIDVNSSDVVARYNLSTIGSVLGLFSGSLYYSPQNTNTSLINVRSANRFELLNNHYQELAFSFTPPGAAPHHANIYSMQEYNGKLFMGVKTRHTAFAADDQNLNSISYWDGNTVTTEVAPGDCPGVPLLGLDHNGNLIAAPAFGYTVEPALLNFILWRNAGVWTSVAIPGSITNFCCSSIAVYNGITYLSGITNPDAARDGVILAWNGSSLSVAHGPSSGANHVTYGGMAVFGGNLYYMVGTGVSLTIGKFDTNTWNDTYNSNFDLTFAGAPSGVPRGCLVAASNQLYVVSHSGSNGYIYATSDVIDWNRLIEFPSAPMDIDPHNYVVL